MCSNDIFHDSTMQSDNHDATSTGLTKFDDLHACYSYGNILEEYTRFFELDNKSRDVKENSDRD